MEINGKLINSFQADIVSFDPQSLSVENNILISETGYRPILGEQKLFAQERDLILDFTNEDSMSNFIAECSKESILNIDDGYRYICWMRATPTIQIDGVNAFTLTVPLYVLKQKPMKSVKALGTITVEGNVTTECIYEITATKNVASFTIDEYKIKNLVANETFILDGIDKLIYRKPKPAVSAFDDTNLMKFPKLTPGQHTFTLSDTTVSVMVKYYPTYM